MMQSKHMKKTIVAAIVFTMITAMFALSGNVAFAKTSQTNAPTSTAAKTTTKPEEKPKVVINIAVISERDAEVDIHVDKIVKDKTYSYEKTVILKKGNNYFSYNRGTKGNYRVSVNAFGDTTAQNLTAVKGKYTLLFKVAPPSDGDSKNSAPIVYQDLEKIKDKK